MVDQYQSPKITCHVCKKGTVVQIPEYSTLNRVTSDAKPWPSGGFLGVCQDCGTAQKSIDPKWIAEIDQIYEQYTIYYQGSGTEQMVFASSGESMTRSARLVERLLKDDWLPTRGRLLDVGCGNGALLRVFSDRLSSWQLAGTELNNKYKSIVEAIPNVEALYVGSPEQVPGRFDLITMVHLLEHIPDPGTLLGTLAEKLTQTGRILIEIPYYVHNPFDLLIADHSTHFTPQTLQLLIERNGFTLGTIGLDWVPKEMTALLVRSGAKSVADIDSVRQTNGLAQECVAWLHHVIDTARLTAQKGQIGLFGTSIAATWLCSELGDLVSFFVDEDPNRIGQVHMGHPVFHPNQVASGATVFIAISPMQLERVKQRMEATYPSLHWATSPMPLANITD